MSTAEDVTLAKGQVKKAQSKLDAIESQLNEAIRDKDKVEIAKLELNFAKQEANLQIAITRLDLAKTEIDLAKTRLDLTTALEGRIEAARSTDKSFLGESLEYWKHRVKTLEERETGYLLRIQEIDKIKGTLIFI